MNAAEHYQMAEECLQNAEASLLGSETERYLLAKGQLHATLAVAASQSRSIATAQAEAAGS